MSKKSTPLFHFRRLSVSICTVMSDKTLVSSSIWLRLIPLLRCLSPITISRQGDHNQDSWWGLDQITHPFYEMQEDEKNSDP